MSFATTTLDLAKRLFTGVIPGGITAGVDPAGDLWKFVETVVSETGEEREDWKELMELRLLAKDNLRGGSRDEPVTRAVGGNWKGAPPKFRNLRWVK